MLIEVVGLLEASVKETSGSLAVRSFVACHFMYGIVDRVKSVLRRAGSKIELAGGCTLLAANSLHRCPVGSVNYSPYGA